MSCNSKTKIKQTQPTTNKRKEKIKERDDYVRLRAVFGQYKEPKISNQCVIIKIFTL